MRLQIQWRCLATALCVCVLRSASTGTPAAPRPKPSLTALAMPAVSLTVFQKPAVAKKTVAAKAAWRLELSAVSPYFVSLKCVRAPVTEIAAELGRRLNVPVILSPVMRQRRVTVDLSDVSLESALLELAPQPYVDFALSGDASVPPQPLALYLHALNEPPPSESTIVKGDTESILIEGNTEEWAAEDAQAAEKEKPLRVTVDQKGISLRAKKQPLLAVLHEIAVKVDIPFEVKYETRELVDGEFNNLTIEQLIRLLSPRIRLYQRVNLSTSETKPLRLVIAPPDVD